MNLRLHSEVFKDLENSKLLPLDQVDLVFKLNHSHRQLACMFLYCVFITPDVLETRFECIKGFILLLGNQLLEFILNGGISHLEGTNGLLEAHSDRVYILEFVDFGLNTVCLEELHGFCFQLNSFKVQLFLVQVKDILVDVKAQIEVVTITLNPIDGLVLLRPDINIGDFLLHRVQVVLLTIV